MSRTTTTSSSSDHNTTAVAVVDDLDDLQSIAAEQRRELMEAEVLESDLDLAFQLQLQEAINASLSLQPSTSSSPPPAPLPRPSDGVLNFSRLQSQELSKLEQEVNDFRISQSEFKRVRDDLHRRIHDKKLAAEIDQMPEDEWEEFGDDYENPYGEGSSKAVNNETFRVYCKGLVQTFPVLKDQIAAIGVAICDSRDELLFQLKKPLVVNGRSHQCVEIVALIEGLKAALALELSSVVFYCDCYPVFQYVMGRWSPKQRKISGWQFRRFQIEESCCQKFVASVYQVQPYDRTCCWLLPHDLQMRVRVLLHLWGGVEEQKSYMWMSTL